MAWQRDEANLGISGATAYSYTEVDWEVHGDKCTYRHIGGVTSPYNFGATATSTLQWWEGGTWHDYAGPASGTFNGYGDLALVDVEDHFVRQAADRVVSLGCYTTMMGGSARAWIDYKVPHLAPSVTWAASNPVVRNSDNSITLTWNAPALEYSAMCLEVSTDGGSWSQFAVLWNTATSYTWTGCSAGHSYQFRIRTNYLSSYSAYDTCATVIVNTPLPPESISTAAAGGTSVTVNLVNPSAVATKVQYQVSNDDGATWGATQDSASLTSFTVTITGTGKVKAWNYNATGVSAAIETESITTICPPAKPTVNSPQSGDVWDVSKPLVVEWVHNKLDGSDQTAAKVTLVKDGTPPLSHVETLDPFTGNTYSIDFATAQGWISGLAVGDVLNVAVKTKGADASYSSNTVVNGIKAYTAPTLSITIEDAVVRDGVLYITGMPISLTAAYSDMEGFTCQEATVSLQKEGRTLFSEPATISGSSITSSLDVSEFLPTNGESYTVVLTARSSSSLQTTANATFTVDFVEPQAGELSITNDPDTGYASLLATFDNSASEITYSGDTNVQYESAEGYVRSLTVDGKSEKWNQLVKREYKDASVTSVNGVTISVSNGYITATGDSTANGSWTVNTYGEVQMIQGHKYLLTGIDAIDGNTSFRIYSNNPVVTYVSKSTATDTIFTANTASSRVAVYFLFSGPRTGITFKGKPSLYDLTAIFGSGNEPATVDAFKATDVYKAKLAAGELYDYDAGSLVSIEGASVTGRNLLPSRFYKGLGYNAAEGANKTDTLQEVSDVTQSGDTFTRSVTAWGEMSMISDRLTAGTYRLSCHVTSENMRMTGYTLTSDLKISRRLGNYESPNEMDYTPTVTLTADECYIAFSVGSASAGNVTITAPMLVHGSTAQTYEPYKKQPIIGRNLQPVTLTNNGVNISAAHATVTVDGDEFVFAATGADMSLGYATYTAGVAYSDSNGVLIPVTAGVRYTLSCTNTAFNKLFIVWWDSSKKTISTSASSTNIQSMTAPATAAYASVRIGKSDSENGVTYKTRVMFEQAYLPSPYVPYNANYAPLRSAGSVHDTLMADADSWTVGRRVGVVDLGSVSWGYNGGTTNPRFYVALPDCAMPTTAVIPFNGLCPLYTAKKANDLANTAGMDMAMAVYTGTLWIVNRNYTDAATFKTAMSGVYLFYELATPTVDTETSMSRIEIGSAFTVATDLDSTFAMTTWDGAAEAVSISVARVNTDGITPLIEDAQSGAGAVDKYAPLNTPYQYAVTTKSSVNAVKTVYVDNEIITDLWFAYWGDNIASAKWNPDNGGIQLSRPQKTRVYYAGRKDPVSYDGSAVALSETPSWMLVDRSEVQPFVQLIEDGGRGVYKSCDGWVYHADFDLTLSPKYTAIGYYGGIMLSVTRIAGDQL